MRIQIIWLQAVDIISEYVRARSSISMANLVTYRRKATLGYVILCFIGESFGWLKGFSPSRRANLFSIKGKLNPKKVTNFHFNGMNSVGK